MKFTKLSLVAAVAVGAFGSFASATPLEEAIKGVDVSGLVRYRYYWGTEGISSNGQTYGQIKGAARNFNRYSASLNVLSPIDDAWSAGVSVRTEGSFAEDERKSGAASYGTLSENTGLEKAFFQYSANGLTAKVGKFEIPTPWTESGYNGNRGNGLLVLFSGVTDWTFGGAYYNSVGGGMVTDNVGFEDLYALAAIGKVGPVGLQFWAAHNSHLFNTVYGEAVFNLNGIYAKGQVNYLNNNKDGYLYNPASGADNSNIFAGLEGGYKGSAGGVNYNAIAGYTHNGKTGTYALDKDNDGFIKFGKQLYYRTTNEEETQVFFLKGGVSVDKFGGELGIGQASIKNGGGDLKQKPLEVYLNGSYAYAKNFGFELYYSYLKYNGEHTLPQPVPNPDYTKKANSEVRFQAQYKF